MIEKEERKLTDDNSRGLSLRVALETLEDFKTICHVVYNVDMRDRLREMIEDEVKKNKKVLLSVRKQVAKVGA